MKDVTSANFGLLIAYVLPGFVLLWGLEPYSGTIQLWLGQTTGESASVGGFLYVTVASVELGLLISTLRWLLMDWLHQRTGIDKPRWDFRRLEHTVAAFDQLIEIHYRYYQWHSNGLLAVSMAAILRWVATGFSWRQFLLLLLIDVLLFLGSRDTLSKYHRRVGELLRAQ